MSAAPISPDPNVAGASRDGCVGRLLVLVRKLIDYGRELAASLQRDPANLPRQFGTTDLALILARIKQGLHRTQALEERLIHNAARLNASFRPRSTASPPKPHAAHPAVPYDARNDPGPTELPTPEIIAARVRRQPIGAVLADICRDLGILPDHPLWQEVSELIRSQGGNLAALLKDVITQAARRVGEAWIAAGLPPGPLPPSPQLAGTGPPDPLV